MGVLPANLQRDLTPATPSTDRTSPLTRVVSPSNGAAVRGPVVTIAGTATDVGGTVAGVEISLDGGKSWHPAEGTDRWSYQWQVPAGAGTTTILTRGSDDTVNVETPGKGVTVRYGQQITQASAPATRRH
jgi:hypothetical protein